MNTLEYLDAVKRSMGIESDYAVAKALNMRTSTISGYRARGGQMDDEICVKVARILGIHPARVMLDMHRERSKSPEVVAAWSAVLEKISGDFKTPMRRRSPRPALHWGAVV